MTLDSNLRLKSISNGVIDEITGRFYPFKTVAVNDLLSTVSPVSRNSRFFVKSAQIAIRLIAADTTTFMVLYGVKDNAPHTLGFVYTVPSVASNTFASVSEINILCDKGAALSCTFGVATPTSGGANFVVAEIDDV